VSQQPDPGPGQDEDPARAFVQGGTGDICPPNAGLGVVLEELSGPGRRCEGATDDEVIGMLGRWAAQESWAAAGKLALVRELIRRRPLRDRDGTPAPGPGDLPGCWDVGLGHEISAALGISLQAADKMLNLALTLQTRLPRIGQALQEGILDFGKAKVIAEETAVLDDKQVGAAEDLILAAGLAGKTWTKLQRHAADAVCTIDPDGTRKRRERAQRDDARVRLWREASGACALAAYGLPPDEALAANASIDDRASQYRDAGLTHPIDLLRVMAYADLINGVPASDRITASAQTGNGHDDSGPDDSTGDQGGPDGSGSPGSPSGPGDLDGTSGDRDGENDVDDAGSADGGMDGAGDGDPSRSAGEPTRNTGQQRQGRPTKPNLTIPFATLLGLAERPGAAHGLGPLDPDLARKLAAAAIRSLHSEWCITIVNEHGHAIAHGCARAARPTRAKPPPGLMLTSPATPAALPARVHLTIRQSDLHGLSDRPAESPWGFTPRGDPLSLHGTWTLTLLGGHRLSVRLHASAVTSCDHRHESHSYKPSALLRHLVQVRDGQCTFPTCTRHARESDFEHGMPYDQGGRTCMCNAGARSRRCHRVKQSPGWNLTQPIPGWHQWTTPAGRVYTQGPMQYPALSRLIPAHRSRAVRSRAVRRADRDRAADRARHRRVPPRPVRAWERVGRRVGTRPDARSRGWSLGGSNP
jgi:hypothetical protein